MQLAPGFGGGGKLFAGERGFIHIAADDELGAAVAVRTLDM
jgi:hypothetical protein